MSFNNVDVFPSFYSDYNEFELWHNLIAKEKELIKMMEDSDFCGEEVPTVGPAGKQGSPADSLSWGQDTSTAVPSREEVTPGSSSVVAAAVPASSSDVATAASDSSSVVSEASLASSGEEVSSPRLDSKEDFPVLGARRRRTNPMSGLSKEVNPTPGLNAVATPVPGLSYKEVASGVGPAYNITASVNGPRSYAEFELRYDSNRALALGISPSNGLASPWADLCNGVAAPAAGLSNGVAAPMAGLSNGIPAPEFGLSNGVAAPAADLRDGFAVPAAGLCNGFAAPVAGLSNGIPAPAAALCNGDAAPAAGLCNGVAPPVSGPSKGEASSAAVPDREATATRNEMTTSAGFSRHVGAPISNPRSRLAASLPGLSNGSNCNRVTSAPGPSEDKAAPSLSNKVPGSVPGLSNQVSAPPGFSNRVVTPKAGPSRGLPTSAAGPSCNVAAPPLRPNKAPTPMAGVIRKDVDLMPGPSLKDPDPAPVPNRIKVSPPPTPKRKKFIPADPNDAAERRRADDKGLGFNVGARGDDGVPEVSANGGYEVVQEGREVDEEDEHGEENESGGEENEADDEGDDDSEESEDGQESEVDSCYYSSEGGDDDNIVYLIAAPPAWALPRPRFVGYYRCRCLRH